MSLREAKEGQRRLAVLIDADNAQASVIEGLLAETAKFGVASVRRIYGDFTSPNLRQWKALLLKHSIQPVQQFAYTSGKNATDSSLIIDAMDLMHTGRFDGFCLVSSDSDFTRLAQRLRESGLTVYGFGERKTPDPFVQACDKFIYTELLRAERAEDGGEAPAAATGKPLAAASAARKTPKAARTPKAETAPPVAPVPAKARPPSPAPVALIRQAIEGELDESGWAALGSVGAYLNKVQPDFDARLYGHRKLSDLIRAHAGEFEIDERGGQGAQPKAIYVRTAGKRGER